MLVNKILLFYKFPVAKLVFVLYRLVLPKHNTINTQHIAWAETFNPKLPQCSRSRPRWE